MIQISSPLRLSIVEGLNLTFGADVAMCEHEVSDSLLIVAALGLNPGSPGAFDRLSILSALAYG